MVLAVRAAAASYAHGHEQPAAAHSATRQQLIAASFALSAAYIGAEAIRSIILCAPSGIIFTAAMRHRVVSAVRSTSTPRTIETVFASLTSLKPKSQGPALEIRCLDAQSSVGDLEALVALVHCLVYHEAITGDPRHPEKEILDEATFRAVRDGLDARISTGGPMHHVQHLARDAMDLGGGYAPSLGCDGALQGLDRLLGEGNGAVRQRRSFEAAGMPGVLRQLVAETCDVRFELTSA
jgi:gamma-glutamyl:cysteine ligase YbdK (ATP-grasp superfamily)